MALQDSFPEFLPHHGLPITLQIPGAPQFGPPASNLGFGCPALLCSLGSVLTSGFKSQEKRGEREGNFPIVREEESPPLSCGSTGSLLLILLQPLLDCLEAGARQDDFFFFLMEKRKDNKTNMRESAPFPVLGIPFSYLLNFHLLAPSLIISSFWLYQDQTVGYLRKIKCQTHFFDISAPNPLPHHTAQYFLLFRVTVSSVKILYFSSVSQTVCLHHLT